QRRFGRHAADHPVEDVDGCRDAGLGRHRLPFLRRPVGPGPPVLADRALRGKPPPSGRTRGRLGSARDPQPARPRMSGKSHLFYQSDTKRPVLAEARGIYMWDVDGRRYIDGSSGATVSNIGHSSPRVLDAMRRQMEKSTFGYRLHFETEPGEHLAAKVAALSPEGMEKVFFVSGGSEAVESAIKLARQYAVTTGQGSRWKVISRAPSYHGSTLGALALTGYDPLTRPFEPMMRAMPKVPAPRAYLDGLDIDDPATGAHYAAMLEAKIVEEGPESVLAFIHEPVGGASTGALVPPAGYMQAVREICDRHGVLLIHDEVMSGGGRTGLFLGA